MYAIEVTDTFGGESNYSWVRRGKVDLKDNMTRQQERRAVIKAVREVAGWSTDIRVDCNSYGEGYEIRPRGLCQVAFVTWTD